ncbi:hypothetical protein [Leifsonia sp. fls2-241-R2A-40a]|uniref:hypothetical protein n=1 Tax=Leifsonia sp. fls2-241-R2A-40a TaxID=3040290 RepID=UPI00254CDA91|nr:hypothetical protein [Leifsonia sp. fls2-241-R2A-40a]
MSESSRIRDPWTIAVTAWSVVAMAYVFLVPVGNNLLLYPLILSFALLAGIAILRNKLRPDRSLLLPAVLWLAFLVLGIVTGIARDAESWQRTLVFFLVWPAVFSVIVVGFDRRLIRVIFTVGAWVTVFIGLLFIVDALAITGHLPFSTLPTWLTTPLLLRGVTDASGMVSLSSSSLPPLIWWGAMWVASLFCDPRDRYLPPVWLRTAAASLAIAGAVVSWRRAIVIILVVSPIIAILALIALRLRNARSTNPRFSGRAFLRLGIAAVIAIALSFMAQPHFASMFGSAVGASSTIVEGQKADLPTKDLATYDDKKLSVTADDALADEIRKNESQNLLSPRSPADLLVGRGFGATIDRGEVVRDMKPWQTELQYHAIFYWTGILGILLLLATFVTAFLAVRKAFRFDQGMRAPLYVSTVGALAALAANATNPYLQAPGHMWPVFLPLMIASAIFVARSREREPLEPRLAEQYT